MTSARPAASLVACLDRLAATRDPVAWADLVDTVGSDLARTCASVAGPELGRDAAQEALIRVRDRAGRFRPPDTGDAEAAARGWVRRVATTTALEMLRARGRARAREVHASHPDEPADPTDDLGRSELADLVRAALASLPVEQREAVAMHHLLGLPLAEVAVAQGVATEAVKKRVQRGAERLRQRLRRLGYGMSLPLLGQALAHLRAAEPIHHRDDALAAFAATPAPTGIGWVKGTIVSIIIGLPAIVAFAVITADGGVRRPIPAGDHPPAVAAVGYPAVSVDFQDTPVQDVAAQLSVLSGLRIVVHPEVPQDAPAMTLKVDGMTVDNVLTFLCGLNALAWSRGDDGVITIRNEAAER